jgi:hypothetical protein
MDRHATAMRAKVESFAARVFITGEGGVPGSKIDPGSSVRLPHKGDFPRMRDRDHQTSLIGQRTHSENETQLEKEPMPATPGFS